MCPQCPGPQQRAQLQALGPGGQAQQRGAWRRPGCLRWSWALSATESPCLTFSICKMGPGEATGRRHLRLTRLCAQQIPGCPVCLGIGAGGVAVGPRGPRPLWPRAGVGSCPSPHRASGIAVPLRSQSGLGGTWVWPPPPGDVALAGALSRHVRSRPVGAWSLEKCESLDGSRLAPSEFFQFFSTRSLECVSLLPALQRPARRDGGSASMCLACGASEEEEGEAEEKGLRRPGACGPGVRTFYTHAPAHGASRLR